MKIVDAIRSRDEPFISVEFYPPRTEEGLKNLKERMLRMQRDFNPLFADFTWGAGGTTSELTLELTLNAKKMGLEPNMHLTCTNVKPDQVIGALDACRAAGVQNIVALRGDPPFGEEKWEQTAEGFACALDLVKHIRERYGNYFNISVAGYPEGHPDQINIVEGGYESLTPTEKRRCKFARDDQGNEVVSVCRDADFARDMQYLKDKVDAGADCILTQMFFDVEVYVDFVNACRDYGITCPVIPGIMCLNAYAGFMKMTKFCKTRVPREVQAQLDAANEMGTEAIKQFGVQFGTKLSLKLLEVGAPGLHFYTLNNEKVVYGIVHELEQRRTRRQTLASQIASNAIIALASVTALFILSKRVMGASA